MEQLADAVLGLAESAWVYPVVFALTVADAFLVIVPSETVVVSLAALSASGGHPNLALLIPVAAVAAIIGDSLTYFLGRAIGVDRFGWMRRPRIAAAIGWATTALDRRAGTFTLEGAYGQLQVWQDVKGWTETWGPVWEVKLPPWARTAELWAWDGKRRDLVVSDGRVVLTGLPADETYMLRIPRPEK